MTKHSVIVLAGVVAMAWVAAANEAALQPADDRVVTTFVSQMAQKLELTAEQQAKVQKIAGDAKATRAADPASQPQIVQAAWAKIAGALTPVQAAYGEVEYEPDGRNYWLTTEYKIVNR